MAKAKTYWLFKTEPDSYSIADLKRDGWTFWEGVRNYQARNSLRDDVAVGNRVLIYHSSADVIGVAGLAEVSKAAYPDAAAWDASSDYFDPNAAPENTVWVRVDIQFVEEFPAVVTLAELKANPKLDGMVVLAKGSRLSIQPVTATHFAEVVRMAKKAR